MVSPTNDEIDSISVIEGGRGGVVVGARVTEFGEQRRGSGSGEPETPVSWLAPDLREDRAANQSFLHCGEPRKGLPSQQISNPCNKGVVHAVAKPRCVDPTAPPCIDIEGMR